MKWTPALLLPLAVLGCESDLPVQPFEQDQPDLAISDAAHSGGRAGFYFLPPLVPNPHATGPSTHPFYPCWPWRSANGRGRGACFPWWRGSRARRALTVA